MPFVVEQKVDGENVSIVNICLENLHARSKRGKEIEVSAVISVYANTYGINQNCVISDVVLGEEKLQEDLKSSMKNKDTVRKSVVTLIRASIKQYEVDNRVELDDEGIIDIISKQLKQRRDALDEFVKANRDDLVSETEAEIKVLKEYLPQQLSEEELNEIVKLTISEVGATSMKDMGKIMSVIRPKVKGRADGKLINELVKANLQ